MINSIIRKTLRAFLILAVCLSAPAILNAGPYNYADALQKSIFFYETEQSGPLPEWNRVEWRADSAVDDGSDVGIDLTGGWYDAGDHVKFGFPMAASVTTIAWGAVQYRDGYEQSGQLIHLLNNLRFINDYFIKAHVVQNGATARFYGQVGQGSADHSYWGSAEMMTMERPAYWISPKPGEEGSELAAETAAAMAASSILFRPTDPAYADTLLSHAEILYTFADNFRGEYDQAISDANAFYHSFNGYIDDLAWGAAWLYMALKDSNTTAANRYLQKAEAFYTEYSALVGTTPEHREYNWTHNWNDKYFASSVLLATETNKTVYKDAAEKNLNWWTIGVNGDKITYTPGGLAWLAGWGPNRYASNASLLAFIYADWTSDSILKQRYKDFAISQIDYILGDNPQNMSYLIGFGSNWPVNPHHRNAHGSWLADIQHPENNRHILYGALAGGPAADDSYKDDREDYRQSEVACDYNSAILGNLARMCMEFGTFTPDPGFPEPEIRDVDEFSIIAKHNAGGGWGFQPLIKFVNQTSWPPRIAENLSAKYFFTLEAGKSISDIRIQDNGGDGSLTITGPHLWSGNTYYAELDLTGLRIAPGGHSDYYEDVYFTINDTTNSFDESDDWSATGMTSEEAPTEYVPLYDNGVRVWGMEPGGPPPTTPPPTTPPPTTPPPSQDPGTVTGDVNGSGTVDIVDALMIAQSYVGLDPLNFNASVADFDGNGSINIVDALKVAQCYVGLIPCLY